MIRTGLLWVVLCRGLPETALGNVLARSVGWVGGLAGLGGWVGLWETGSRSVAPRHFSRRSNLRGATSLTVACPSL